MKYLFSFILFIALLSYDLHTKADIKLSNQAEISVLTCSPGEELYSLFGHTAIRVKDSIQNLDLVFNYGTFDFSTEGFYLKYIKGLLPYQLSISDYSHFYYAYQQDKRTIYSQQLQLDSISKQKIIDKLLINYQPKNRSYLYNFLFDNCTTRSRDIIDHNTTSSITWKETNQHLSFWNLLDQYLNYAPWSQWGIHTILGQSGNKIATPYQYMFLPDYLMYGLDSAYYNGKLLVNKRKIVYDSGQKQAAPLWYKSPYTIFSIFTLALIFLCYYFKNNKILNSISFLLYLTTGILGCLILFLGFFTLHPITAPNWNILWANPLNLILSFLIFKNYLPRVIQWYLTLYCVILITALGLWYFLYPAVSLASMPIIILLLTITILIKVRKRKHLIK